MEKPEGLWYTGIERAFCESKGRSTMSDDLKKGILTEWLVTSQGYVETASATWITEGANRIRVTELLPKGEVAARDEAIVEILERGMPGPDDPKGQEIHKPRWYQK